MKNKYLVGSILLILGIVVGYLLSFIPLPQQGTPEQAPKVAQDTLQSYLETVADNPSKFNKEDLSRYTVVSFEDLFPVFKKLSEKNPEIMDAILTYDSFKINADPRISLEGFIYQQFQSGSTFSNQELRQYSVDSEDQLSMVLREIYLKDTNRFNEFTKTYYSSGIVPEPHYFIHSSEADNLYDFFLEQQRQIFQWPGWKYDLTADEKIIIYEGKRLVDSLAKFNKNTPISDIQKEIDTFNEYIGRYSSMPVSNFYLGGIWFYETQATLYALNGDFDKAITIAHEATERLKNMKPRREANIAYTCPSVFPIEGVEGRFYAIRASIKEKNGDKTGATMDYKSAENLMHHNLLANPFGVLDIFALWRDIKNHIQELEKTP